MNLMAFINTKLLYREIVRVPPYSLWVFIRRLTKKIKYQRRKIKSLYERIHNLRRYLRVKQERYEILQERNAHLYCNNLKLEQELSRYKLREGNHNHD